MGMKKTYHLTRHGLLLLAAVALLSYTAGGISFADDHHDAWSHDKQGYWDDHGKRHAFIQHENHHGYWRTREDGTRLFINID
jgi:hypothetical protein